MPHQGVRGADRVPHLRADPGLVSSLGSLLPSPLPGAKFQGAEPREPLLDRTSVRIPSFAVVVAIISSSFLLQFVSVRVVPGESCCEGSAVVLPNMPATILFGVRYLHPRGAPQLCGV